VAVADAQAQGGGTQRHTGEGEGERRESSSRTAACGRIEEVQPVGGAEKLRRQLCQCCPLCYNEESQLPACFCAGPLSLSPGFMVSFSKAMGGCTMLSDVGLRGGGVYSYRAVMIRVRAHIAQSLPVLFFLRMRVAPMH
jgi:hypothetical protein